MRIVLFCDLGKKKPDVFVNKGENKLSPAVERRTAGGCEERIGPEAVPRDAMGGRNKKR